MNNIPESDQLEYQMLFSCDNMGMQGQWLLALSCEKNLNVHKFIACIKAPFFNGAGSHKVNNFFRENDLTVFFFGKLSRNLDLLLKTFCEICKV